MRFGQRVDIDRGHEDIRARRHRKAHANRSSGREEDVEMLHSICAVPVLYHLAVLGFRVASYELSLPLDRRELR